MCLPHLVTLRVAKKTCGPNYISQQSCESRSKGSFQNAFLSRRLAPWRNSMDMLYTFYTCIFSRDVVHLDNSNIVNLAGCYGFAHRPGSTSTPDEEISESNAGKPLLFTRHLCSCCRTKVPNDDRLSPFMA